MANRTDPYSVNEAAGVLGCHEQSVRNWWRAGTLTGTKVGKALQLTASSVESHERFLAKPAPSLARRVARLERQVAALRNTADLVGGELQATQTERDEQRARASRLQTQALHLQTGNEQLRNAAQSLLKAMEAQSEAVSESLLPHTPADLD